jgi:hypothetical protein
LELEMKRNLGITTLALLAILCLASCGEQGPANKPETAAAVMLSATPLCMTTVGSPISVMTISPVNADSFLGSDYHDEISNPACYWHKVVFTQASVHRGGQTYEMNGTLYLAFVPPTNSVYDINGTWSADTVGYFYATGFSVSGPDYDATFDADCKASIGFSCSPGAGSYTITVTASLNGSVAGRKFSNEGLSISATI